MTIKFSGFILSALSIPALFGSDATPVWDLQKDKIELKSGKIEKQNGTVKLDGTNAFAIPASAFKDLKNFTAKVSILSGNDIRNGEFSAMNKEGKTEDSGFSFSMTFRKGAPSWGQRVNSVVNKVVMGDSNSAFDKNQGLIPGQKFNFVVVMRNGFASFYLNDRPYKKCYMEVRPNNEPMWIGKNSNPKTAAIPMTVTDAKVFGSDYQYVSPQDRKVAEPRGVVAGHGWALNVPTVRNADWPKVMFYGDSISMGYYGPFVSRMLKNKIYAYHFCHFVNGKTDKKALKEAAANQKFSVIVFNNGLHSLHWTPEKVSDQEVYDRTRDIVRSFREGAPQAKLIWLQTTPHTGSRVNGKVSTMGELNPIVLRLNRISAQVMADEKVDVIDTYALLEKRLDLAAGDHYHWSSPAYKMIADVAGDAVLKAISEKK